MEEISTEQITTYMDIGMGLLLTYGPPLLLALIVLFVGLWIINRVVSLALTGMEKTNTEPTLAKFLSSLVSVGLKALLLISVASMVGIQTTSFIAILGAAGLAIGLALQGSLANFAGGVLVLLFKPFKVGDFVEAQGVMGTVAEIQIFSTVIRTGDNKRIIVPNGAISNGIITNYSAEATRRVDFVFGIGYDDDIAKAKAVLERLFASDERVFADPAPTIVVSSLGDSAVNITVRAWANSADYWAVYFGMTELVKLTFDQEGITIPYPQRDVHHYGNAV
jgi:small conductance mechanosensitive channel